MTPPYVFVCLGCDLLAVSDRNDALTCSPACRVRAHRNGKLKILRAEAWGLGIPPGMLTRSQALNRLCPHLGKLIMARKLDSVNSREARQQVWDAFVAHLESAGVL